MKHRPFIVPVLAGLLLFPAAASRAQRQADYLTREEVTLVRDTMEPQKRIKLFLDFAGQRLARLEGKLRISRNNPEKYRRDLTEKFDHYIRAVDDAAGHLEMWLERGGVDLRKLRKQMPKAGENLLLRLNQIHDTHQPLLETGLRYDLEDAIEATEEMLDLSKKIPETVIPPQAHRSQTATAPNAPPKAGRPSLRRKGEDGYGQKPDKDKKPPPQTP